MRSILIILLVIILASQAFSGPPEPPLPPEPPRVDNPKVGHPKTDSIHGIPKVEVDIKNIPNMDSMMQSMSQTIDSLTEKIKIREITIGGESIAITLDNDSSLIFHGTANIPPPTANSDSRVNLGKKIVVEEGKTIEGNIVNIGSDVVVRGTVNGSVMTVGSNIYVTSTGYIRDNAVAFSGKVKQDPGARIGSMHLSFNERAKANRVLGEPANPFRVMAIVFLVIFIIWLFLAAIFTSLLRSNVTRVVESIRSRPLRSYFMGYLYYVLLLVGLVVLIITVIGIPLALLGIPLLTLGSMILSHAALSNIIGQRFKGNYEVSRNNFLYGTLILSGLPGLFFLLQLITGSLVVMIFSWIMIGFYVLVIIPIGLGAVFVTRFGTRPDSGIISRPIAPAPATSDDTKIGGELGTA